MTLHKIKIKLYINMFLLFVVIALMVYGIVSIDRMCNQLRNTNHKIDNIHKDIKKNKSLSYNVSGDTEILVNKYCKKYNVEPSLVKAIIHVESKGKHDVRSHSGAIGIMQLTPHTAKSLGVDPYDKEQNIHGGVKYLSYLNNKFDGDIVKVVASYNAGEGTVIRHNGVPPYRETQNYVQRVLSIMENLI